MHERFCNDERLRPLATFKSGKIWYEDFLWLQFWRFYLLLSFMIFNISMQTDRHSLNRDIKVLDKNLFFFICKQKYFQVFCWFRTHYLQILHKNVMAFEIHAGFSERRKNIRIYSIERGYSGIWVVKAAIIGWIFINIKMHV